MIYILCVDFQGNKVKTELIELAKDLPVTCDKLAKGTRNMGPACEYYKDFVSFTLNR